VQTQICETSKGVKSYGGYVHMPGAILSDVGGFNISTYFLYFEARNNPSTAPLAVYLAGGPGESSVYTALASESGPCYVNTAGNATELNPWSFNNNVNMLYIDQPVQTGFSYDSLVNGTFNLTSEIITPLEFNSSTAVAATDPLTTWGTFPSQDPLSTTNTTVASARAV
jgi:carboxypeptidase C (cathepsin A)